MFIAKPERYTVNRKQAASLTAAPAIQITPTMESQPAIILRSLGMIHGVLPIAEALRVAHAIADAVEAAKTPKP